jgi:hypothetical protein
VNPTLAGEKCELCQAPALWSICRAERERGFIVGWVGQTHLRCGQHVTSIDAIERAEGAQTLAGKGRRK